MSIHYKTEIIAIHYKKKYKANDIIQIKTTENIQNQQNKSRTIRFIQQQSPRFASFSTHKCCKKPEITFVWSISLKLSVTKYILILVLAITLVNC